MELGVGEVSTANHASALATAAVVVADGWRC
jgi:hypothetical protein